MRDRYRFTIQWSGDTADKVQAGEALNSFGNRKSKLIVAAVAEYIKAHPESLSSGRDFKAAIEPTLTRSEIKALVVDIIDARLASAPPITNETKDNRSPGFVVDDDLNAMLKNLKCFSQ